MPYRNMTTVEVIVFYRKSGQTPVMQGREASRIHYRTRLVACNINSIIYSRNIVFLRGSQGSSGLKLREVIHLEPLVRGAASYVAALHSNPTVPASCNCLQRNVVPSDPLLFHIAPNARPMSLSASSSRSKLCKLCLALCWFGCWLGICAT